MLNWTLLLSAPCFTTLIWLSCLSTILISLQCIHSQDYSAFRHSTVYSLDTAKTTSSFYSWPWALKLLSTSHMMYSCWKKQGLFNDRIKHLFVQEGCCNFAKTPSTKRPSRTLHLRRNNCCQLLTEIILPPKRKISGLENFNPFWNGNNILKSVIIYLTVFFNKFPFYLRWQKYDLTKLLASTLDYKLDVISK